MSEPKLMLSSGKRIMLLALLMVLGWCIAGACVYLIGLAGKPVTVTLRLGAVMNDLFAFILPAVGLSVMVTRLPARFLLIDRLPSRRGLLLTIAATVLAIPAVNFLIEWNETWPLPEALVQAEHQAAAATELLLGTGTVADLVMGLLIVGILAPVAEELFFRGALQGTLMSTRMNPQVAVWVTAFIFSLMHFQFMGFVPRMALGAIFGYSALYTRSLWAPILAHAVNNSLVVITQWMVTRGTLAADSDHWGLTHPALSIISALLTIGCIWSFRKH